MTCEKAGRQAVRYLVHPFHINNHIRFAPRAFFGCCAHFVLTMLPHREHSWIVMREGVPGCNVASTTFFARQSSGVIRFSSPFLYLATRFFASSSPVPVTSKVLTPPPHIVSPQSAQVMVFAATLSGKIFPGMVYTSLLSHLGSDISADCLTRPQ